MNSRRYAAMGAVVMAVAWLGFGSLLLAQDTSAAPAFDVKLTGDYGYHLPPNIAAEGYAHTTDTLINVLHYFMVALFVGWGIFFVYCLVKFRQRAGHQADASPIKAKASKYAEICVALFEGFLLVGLSIPAWASAKSGFPSEDKNPLHIRVVAEQFQWNFHYPGPDGIFGKTSPEYLDLATNILGIDPADEHGKDDIASTELHIPVNRPVIADISSKDVIHSFSIAVLRIKQDAIPGMRIPIWFEANQTGNYEVACAQLCGNNHYSMRALMIVEDPTTFDAWYAKAAEGPEEFDEDELD